MTNFTRVFEDNFFKLPGNIYIYFLLTSLIYFIIYNLIPGSVTYLINDNFGVPKIFQILLLAGSTFLIGIAVISFGGMQEMQLGKLPLIVQGRATLAYHLYNLTMVIIPYLISLYFVSRFYPAASGGVADG
jgi:hypothetical protein